VNTIRCIELRK